MWSHSRHPAVQKGEVGSHKGVDAGLLHLDDHLATVGERRRVNLPDGRAAQSGIGEGSEQLVHVLTQLCCDPRSDDRRWHRGDVVLQLGQFHLIRLREGCTLRRDELPKLDEDGPEFFKRLA